ncbi:MAG: hypothetical protein OEY99_01200 [Aigarchaeota archaeon]|nr:hypothetical protein [Aigarchaeota archaeon]MDH5702807.1 hypothetical protein [Aigarchaeota archaeon]
MPITTPLHIMVLELSGKAGGKTLESNLIEELKNRGIQVNADEMNAALIKLEINGKIRVTKLGKDQRIIEVVEPTTAEKSRSS